MQPADREPLKRAAAEKALELVRDGMLIGLGSGSTVSYFTEGVGRCQRRGGPIEIIWPGDRVYFEPGEHHWHGAGPDRFMAHVAMQEVDESGNAVTWGEHVSDEDYAAEPA